MSSALDTFDLHGKFPRSSCTTRAGRVLCGHWTMDSSKSVAATAVNLTPRAYLYDMDDRSCSKRQPIVDRPLVAAKILCRLRVEVNHTVKKPSGQILPHKSARLERGPCRSSLKAIPGGMALTIWDRLWVAAIIRRRIAIFNTKPVAGCARRKQTSDGFVRESRAGYAG